MLLVDDRALLEGFRRGDRKALEKVYTTFSPTVAGFLRAGFSFSSGGRRCQFRGARSQFDLEDRLHDVFSRAFSEGARNAYDGLSPYRAYLLTIARNVVIDDFRRKENVLVEYSLEEREDRLAHEPSSGLGTDPLTGEAEATGNPPVDAESAELVTLVKHFREGLPAREQQIFTLRFEEEREHKDIAVATGLSPSKIKTSEQRIREAFFEFMQSHGYFQGYQRTRRGWLSAILSLEL